MTEYAPKPEDCYATAIKVLQYLKSKGVKTVICMEGTPKFEGAKIMAVASGPNSEKLLKKSGVDVMSEGIIRGFVGIMMYEAPSRGMDIITIMVPATAGVPDPGSSASFIEPISKLIPGFKTKPNELLKEAAIIQQQMEMATKNLGETSQYIG
jgi:predicted ATP-grasp superfamily ATP-dependent carboligase